MGPSATILRISMSSVPLRKSDLSSRIEFIPVAHIGVLPPKTPVKRQSQTRSLFCALALDKFARLACLHIRTSIGIKSGLGRRTTLTREQMGWLRRLYIRNGSVE